jgi:hypothetical protein
MSLLPMLTATTLAVCPHLPAEARATFVPERDLYGIYDLVIHAYERRAVAKELAPLLGQNVSTEDAECALLPAIDVDMDDG